MKKVQARPYDGPTEARICGISGRPFKQEAGALQYSLNDEPVSAEVAGRAGFVIPADVAPPSEVTSKVQLSEWISSLGLRHGGEHYNLLYAMHSGFYPLK